MGRLGRVLGDLGGVLRASSVRLEASWGGFGRLRGVLEALWRALKNIKKPFVFIVFSAAGLRRRRTLKLFVKKI